MNSCYKSIGLIYGDKYLIQGGFKTAYIVTICTNISLFRLFLVYENMVEAILK